MKQDNDLVKNDSSNEEIVTENVIMLHKDIGTISWHSTIKNICLFRIIVNPNSFLKKGAIFRPNFHPKYRNTLLVQGSNCILADFYIYLSVNYRSYCNKTKLLSSTTWYIVSLWFPLQILAFFYIHNATKLLLVLLSDMCSAHRTSLTSFVSLYNDENYLKMARWQLWSIAWQ